VNHFRLVGEEHQQGQTKLANDLQRELKGLRGFSYTNLKNMRQFADEYPFVQLAKSEFIDESIGQSSTVQLKKAT
tara:strand:+ start:1502 stop:1726 length:225 start_codon:yes stop_codon:yes gene_type:complete